ncbi:methyltransferase [Synoicihabitans lomoniglobus]|uniref:Methyltransferase n=1 Tax=Synoicihabitans lomoniglobus TaxID=2909285 RepID=A0AAE9ZU57_9BACT|nr:methyltransferase [Opitutaceae bacterium LMO-M01]WED64152.1 methyltransferase [Opitutaceae bacterium LMO-M01]
MQIFDTPVYDLPSIAFFGRSLTEYRKFFDLDLDALCGRSVLDVAAGPASFTAEACRAGIEAVAVDPLYGKGAEALAAHVQLDYGHMFNRMRETANQARFRFKSFASIDAAERDRRAAAQRFLNDYDAHFVHGRYFGAALPQLPFLDRGFDVVLCAHLLFLYPASFDYAFHVAACRELMRVARDEVRIHPICGPDGKPYAELTRLTAELRDAGIEAREVAIDYEFFVGSNTTLILTRLSS